MKSILSLALLCALPALSLSEPPLGKSRRDVTKELKDNKELKELPKDRKSKNWYYTHTLAEPIANEEWTVGFEYDRGGKKLLRVHMETGTGIPLDQFDTTLKSYYVHLLNAVKAHCQLPAQSDNTPEFKVDSNLKKGLIYPVHGFRKGLYIYTMVLRYDRKTKSVYVGYTIAGEAGGDNKTAMGTKGLPNDEGDAAIWEDVPKWSGLPDDDDKKKKKD